MLTVSYNPRYDTVPLYAGWRYDYGQQICVTDLPALPSTVEVHFTNEVTSYKQLGIFSNGTLICRIPNPIMRTLDWACHIFLITEDVGTTIFTINVHLTDRIEAVDTVEPEDVSIIDQIVAYYLEVIAAGGIPGPTGPTGATGADGADTVDAAGSSTTNATTGRVITHTFGSIAATNYRVAITPTISSAPTTSNTGNLGEIYVLKGADGTFTVYNTGAAAITFDWVAFTI